MRTEPYNTRATLFGQALIMALALLSLSAVARAQNDNNTVEASPSIHEPGPAVRATRVTERYTDPGMTMNPISLTFDPQGGLYVCEAWRAGNAALAIVWQPLRESNSLEDDLKMNSVEDRAAHIERLIAGGFYPREQFTAQADKVRFVQDTDDDGKADKSTLFADGFNSEVDGIAAGVLWHEGKVYLTNIPHLWVLQDKDGDGDADKTTEGERVSLSYGYGLRWGYSGHDLHGLVLGPDGRIYFSLGDRGFNVTNQEGKQLVDRSRGAVFRMWPDGSGLEIYFHGLRNPQDLAFDNYGNLFTGDNNSDAGDAARFIYLPEGGDCGWDQDVQSLPSRGPWNREKMWHLRKGKDDLYPPAWIIPPIGHFGRGPAGLAHYPGTGDAFAPNGSFLMCHFPLGIRHVQVEPNGASFRITEDSSFVDDPRITDLAWGYDGRLYLGHWGPGLIANDKGYIKTMTNPAAHREQAEVIAQVRSLFANGFVKLSDKELLELLGHRDQRVRMAAQFELAKRPVEDSLWRILTDHDKPELARLHALWTAGMKARSDDAINELTDIIIPSALDDPSAQVRAQAVRLLGELGANTSWLAFDEMLGDKNAAVQYQAAIALGKTGDTQAIGSLLDLLYDNNNEDVVLRHAASYGLSLIGDAQAIHDAAKGRGPAERLGVVLALRRLKSPLLAEYLDDQDPLVAAEAARAIYDKHVMDAFPVLAALSDKLPPERMVEPVMRRVIEANVRLADEASAMRLARIAANAQAPPQWRELALREIDQWSAERKRGGVWGLWWPREPQPMDEARSAMLAYLPKVRENATGDLLTLARAMTQRHIAQSPPEMLAKLALDPKEPLALRQSTLKLLLDADRPQAGAVAKQLIESTEAPAPLRIDARLVLINVDQQAGLDAYVKALESGETIEQQDAIERIGAGPGRSAVTGGTMVELSQQLERGQLAPELRLEVVETISMNQALPPQARAAVQRYIQQNSAPDELPIIRDTVLAGGSIERGRDLFLNHSDAQCQRCHTVGGAGSLGPDLGAIGTTLDMNALYTALIKPNADIAEGYASTAVTLQNGSITTGQIVASKSTAETLVLVNSDGVETAIERSQIRGEPVTSDVSIMPAMNDKLSPHELRDVLAYLVSLKGEGGKSALASVPKRGAQVVSPARDLQHGLVLTLFLLGIAAALGLLLAVTMLGGRR